MEKQKIDYFKRLSELAILDQQFFERLYRNLSLFKRIEYYNWVKNENEQKLIKIIEALLNVIEKVSENLKTNP